MISSLGNLQGIPEKPESRKEAPGFLKWPRSLWRPAGVEILLGLMGFLLTWVLASLGVRMQQFWGISKHTGRVQDKAGFLSRVEDLESTQGWFHRIF